MSGFNTYKLVYSDWSGMENIIGLSIEVPLLYFGIFSLIRMDVRYKYNQPQMKLIVYC